MENRQYQELVYKAQYMRETQERKFEQEMQVSTSPTPAHKSAQYPLPDRLLLYQIDHILDKNNIYNLPSIICPLYSGDIWDYAAI